MSDWKSVDWKVIDPKNPKGETLAVYKDLKKADAKEKQQEEYPGMAILPVFTEHNKFHDRRDEHMHIVNFLQFMEEEYGVFSYYDSENDQEATISFENSIAQYFGINKDKFEAEKRAMLDNPGMEPV